MTFDEQLRRDLSALADRLRDEILRETQTVGDELSAQHEIDRQSAVGAAVEAAEARAGEEREQHARSAERASSERLLAAIRTIDRAGSLTDILNALADCAAREAPRVAVLLVRKLSLSGWRFVGFGPAFEPASTVELPFDEHSIIAEAIRTGAAVSGDTSGQLPASAFTAPAFAMLPGGLHSLAVPIAMSGDIVAVLYADQGANEQSAPSTDAAPDGHGAVTPAASSLAWPLALESMARYASRCLEAVTAVKAVRVLRARPDVASPASLTEER